MELLSRIQLKNPNKNAKKQFFRSVMKVSMTVIQNIGINPVIFLQVCQESIKYLVRKNRYQPLR